MPKATPEASKLQSELAKAVQSAPQSTAQASEAKAVETMRANVARTARRNLPKDVWSRINPFSGLAKGPGFRQTARKVAKSIARAVSFSGTFAKGRPVRFKLDLDLSARTIQNGLNPILTPDGKDVREYQLLLAFADGGQVLESTIGDKAVVEYEVRHVVIAVRPSLDAEKRPVISPQFLGELLADPSADFAAEVAATLGLK